MRKFFTIILLLLSFCAIAQVAGEDGRLERQLNIFFLNYKPKHEAIHQQSRMVRYTVDNNNRTLSIVADASFASQDFTPSIVRKIYSKIRKAIPKPYNKYEIKLFTNGMLIEELIPNSMSSSNMPRLWGDIEYKGAAWVYNESKPNVITHGLQNRHISLWASHGRYYDHKKDEWRWQRPSLFCTTEDLYTQTIVVPYLMPMLENAGAIVFTPRERDWQKYELIVDNDDKVKTPYYTEYNISHDWRDTHQSGFARHIGMYRDGENPFEKGTARMIKSTSRKNSSSISYQPPFPKAGRYAVYVSYQTLPNSVEDAQYIVYHKGEETHFRVNQKMGGGTWVYLGTFDFDEGCNIYNRVVVTNSCKDKGVVTSDAVRFGGGMGNIERGGSTSLLPRALEGARYYAQWAGAPYSVYSSKYGEDDYSDDINTRSYMTNWLAGGSLYAPTIIGKNVPIELSLAIHSDAGYSRDGNSLVGSLAIYTTNFNDGKLNSGISRMSSKDFASSLLYNVDKDIKAKYNNWAVRYLWDRNYSETRNPEIPSAILETMSHQNFPDMRYGQDPNFRFTLARSIYKTILRYISTQHGRPYIVQPLSPDNFRIEFTEKNKITLRWNTVEDEQESTATPTSFNVYTAIGRGGFDNGINVKGNSFTTVLEPGVLYSFRITATNRGGESFPTEVLSALSQSNATQTVLIVNGFKRLSSPAIRDNFEEQGFDLDKDVGVSYGLTAGWNGRQQCFDRNKMGIEDVDGLGFSGEELAGKFIAGNDFNYVRTHAAAIQTSGKYNIVSCSNEALISNFVDMNQYKCVDMILGLEKNDGHSLKYYKTFTPDMQKKLADFTRNNGRLVVSGSYIGSDMSTVEEKEFLSNILKINFAGTEQYNDDEQITGMGTSFDIYRMLNEEHYSATSPDIITPVDPAYSALLYSDGQSAGVAYSGNDYKCFSMGFPFECIKSEQTRAAIMRAILDFIMR